MRSVGAAEPGPGTREARHISHGDVFNPKNWPSSPAENHGFVSMG